MLRCHRSLLFLLLSPWVVASAVGVQGAALVPETTAVNYGLTSAWFNQIQVDPARGRVQDVTLHEGTLFVTTDRAMLHAIDAETGRTLWVQQVGLPEHPTLPPGANKKLVAVLNGSSLYVLDRSNGKLLWKTQVKGAPGAGPAVSDRRVYVPMVNGLLVSYYLQPLQDPLQELGKGKAPQSSSDEKKSNGEKKSKAEKKEAQEARRRENLRLANEEEPPLSCQSWGRAMVQPMVLRQNEDEEYLAWPTDRGVLFVGGINRLQADAFTVRYQMGTSGGIAAQPSYLPPDPKVVGDVGTVFAASRDGFVYAVREKDGSSLWRFSTGESLTQRAVAIDPRIYAATQFGGLYCLDAAKGSQLWWAPQVTQFVAASKNRVYATDRIGQIQILDARQGVRLSTLPILGFPMRLTNTETDRVYLASEDGLIQCLREIELAQPLHHNQLRQKPAGPAPTKQKAMGNVSGAEKAAEGGADPFAAGEKGAAPAKPARKPSGGHPAHKAKAKEEGGLMGAVEGEGGEKAKDEGKEKKSKRRGKAAEEQK